MSNPLLHLRVLYELASVTALASFLTFVSLTRSAPATSAPLLFLEDDEQLSPLAFSFATPSAQHILPSNRCTAHCLISIWPLLSYHLLCSPMK